jgi:hypothetical protein
LSETNQGKGNTIPHSRNKENTIPHSRNKEKKERKKGVEEKEAKDQHTFFRVLTS